MPAGPEGAVAAGDHLGVDPGDISGFVGVGDVRGVGGYVVDDGVGHLVDALGGAGRHEILLYLGLTVDPDTAAGQVDEVEMVPPAGPLQIDPAVLVALGAQPVTEADL